MEREIIDLLGLFVIGVPLLSLSVRLALHPLLGAVRDLQAAFEALSTRGVLETARLAQLESEIGELRSQLAGANEALEFDRELRRVPSVEAPALPPV